MALPRASTYAIALFLFSFVRQKVAGFSSRSTSLRPSSSRLRVGDSEGRYYGESGGSFMVKDFSMFEQLQEIVSLAAQALPERPDGVVCVAKYTSSQREDCRATEAQYERLARDNPATIFLRCFEEYENAEILLAKAGVQKWPTYDIFYGGSRVARVDGPDFSELEKVLGMYQFQNSKLDLFSDSADNKRKLQWAEGKVNGANKTPRTTNRFVAGYDWNSDRGFFDDLGDKAQDDFENTYGNWLPNVDDD